MSQKCVSRRSTDGKPCTRWASHGATVCTSHGSLAPQVARAALVRAEVARWQLGDATDDPGDVLLRLLTQSRQRADLLAELLAEQYASPDPITNIPAGVKALIGHRFALDQAGSRVPVEEVIRALVQLEAQERDRLARFAALAVTAGLAERQVRVEEAKVQLLIGAMMSAFTALGMDDAEQDLARLLIAARLRAAETITQ